ncbi:hypothetical protein ACIRL3_44010 [Streptomyces sp. NPDC102384]|uniref:hypothetical protein n=1 Tax=Streptomyces sp. NPDC102384 TaxID=3366166 RepID=UPI0038259CE3
MKRVERPGHHRAEGDVRNQVDQLSGEETEFEHRLGALLDGYAEDAPAPTDTLVAGGLARGRRMRARRRALWGAGTVACASALAAVVVVSWGAPNRAPAQAGGVTIPEFAPAAAATGAPPGKTALTGKEAVAELRDLLPKGEATGARWWDGNDDEARPTAGGRLLLDGAEVTVDVQGNFQLTGADGLTKDAARKAARSADGRQDGRQDKSGKVAPDKSAAAQRAKEESKSDGKNIRPATRAELRTFYSCAARTASDATLSGCAARNLTDGSVLITYQESHGDLVERTADLLRKDGTRVVLTAANAADAKKGPASTATPPLTAEQLTDMARSKTWQPWV